MRRQKNGKKQNVTNMRVNDRQVAFTKDNTMLIVDLPEPIMPGSVAKIECAFTTQFGSQGGRMKVLQLQWTENTLMWCIGIQGFRSMTASLDGPPISISDTNSTVISEPTK